MAAASQMIAKSAQCCSLLQSLQRLGALRPFTASAINTTALVKELREQSGAPISDVKACLQQAGWDTCKALELLKQKGLAAAAKKASRSAAEGLVGLAVLPGTVAVVEVNSETDFVARNSSFVSLVHSVANAVANAAQAHQLSDAAVELETKVVLQLPVNATTTVSEASAHFAAQVRENIVIRRAYCMSSSGVLGSYIHAGAAKGVGNIAAVIELQPADKQSPGLQQLANDLAMHVAGMNPVFIDSNSVPQDYLTSKKEKLIEEAAKEGKVGKVVQQMVQGRLNKHLQDICLLQQPYILDDSKLVQDVLKQQAIIKRFWRIERGQGLAVNTKDLASEVAELLKTK